MFSIPGADLTKIGSNIAKDLYEGKDLKSTIKERYAYAVMIKYNVSTISFDFSGEETMKSVGGNMAKVAFDVAKDLDNGESIPNTILKKYNDSYTPWEKNLQIGLPILC